MELFKALRIAGYSALAITLFIIILYNYLDQKKRKQILKWLRKRVGIRRAAGNDTEKLKEKKRKVKEHFYDQVDTGGVVDRLVFSTSHEFQEITESFNDLKGIQVIARGKTQYFYSSTDYLLTGKTLYHSDADVVILFQHLPNHLGIQFPPRPGIFKEAKDGFVVTEESITHQCLIDQGIVKIVNATSDIDIEICTVTLPQWGDRHLIDYYSMLLLHEFLTHLRDEKGADIFKVLIRSDQATCIPTITVLETLNSKDAKLLPEAIIKELGQKFGLFMNKECYAWVSETLSLCTQMPIERDTLESYALKHPESSRTYEYYKLVLRRLKDLVPKMNMKQCVAAAMHENRAQNRNSHILPLDTERPYLGGPSVPPMECDYINATFIKGYHSANQFVVAEWPLKPTMPMFWRLVHHYDISTIVVVDGMSAQLKKYPTFWPTKKNSDGVEQKTYGRFIVRHLTGSEKCQHRLIRKNNLEVTEDTLRFPWVQKCTLYHISAWPREMVNVDESFLRSIVNLATKARKQRSSSAETQLCLVSPDGVSKCGVILSLWAILDQIYSSDDEEFDYLNTLRLIKLNRPHLFSSVEDLATLDSLLQCLATQK